ncbi:RDD family protein [Hamadaea tsunoensis]|uniref:RDD family protein n=1 Tax=Hamadaea tsunoensis TaxID=53368 RepID=UPI000406827B|nr:RDD family protein [Hamadaea tsunoensis]
MIIALAGPGRRAAGFFLDVLLFVVTLGVGWLIWSIWLWSSARTPGKQILRMRVVDGLTGEPVGWRRMALRQAVYGIGIAGLFGAATVGVGWAISAVFVLSPTRQALWDRLAFTTVALVPGPAANPATVANLAAEAAADTVPLLAPSGTERVPSGVKKAAGGDKKAVKAKEAS